MSFIRKQLYFFIKKLSEIDHKRFYQKKNQFYINRYNVCEQKKPAQIIRKEMNILKKYWKTYPFQYFRYNMYRSDCCFSIDEMKCYIPDYFAYYLLYPKSFLSRNLLCEDKFLFYAICEGFQITQAQTILLSKEKHFYTHRQNPIDKEDAFDIIIESDSTKIFCKPRYGIGGGGIIVLQKEKEQYINKESSTIVTPDFLNNLLLQDYIIQKGIVQHAVMNSIYPNSVNTFRIITEYKGNAEIAILFTLLRMGNKGMDVDNASSGGIYIGVNVVTGELQKYAISNQQEIFEYHPYSGFKFESFFIPFWQEIVTFIKNVAFKFSEIRYIGWDVAYSVDGPVIIEANNGPDISIIQDCFGGVKKQFHINCPDDFWFSNKFSIKDL